MSNARRIAYRFARSYQALILAAAAFLVGCGSGVSGAGTPPSSPSRSVQAPSPADSSNAAASGTYQDHGVAFEYPASWRELDPIGPEGTAWEATFGPAGSAGYVSVVAYEFDETITESRREAFADNFFKYVKSDALGDIQQGGVDDISVGGVPALQVVFVSLAGYKTAAVFSDGSTIYGFSCFLENKPAVETIEPCTEALESLRFTENG